MFVSEVRWVSACQRTGTSVLAINVIDMFCFGIYYSFFLEFVIRLIVPVHFDVCGISHWSILLHRLNLA